MCQDVVDRNCSKQMSEYVCQEFFALRDDAVHSGCAGISKAGSHGDHDELTQWRASLSECCQIFAFVIGDPIFPATEYDANPFESQGPHHCVVVLALIALLLVIRPGPGRLRNRVTGPFVKALPQKLRTCPAEMHPFPFPAPLRHRRDPTVGLQFVGAAVTISLRAKAANSRGAITAPAPGSDSKMKKSGCSAAASSIFLCKHSVFSNCA